MTPHDPPAADQLLEAVRECLTADVLPVVTGRVQYLVRVCINTLAVVERELLASDRLDSEHEQRLQTLGFESAADLCAAIRSGAVDHEDPRVHDAVLGWVLDKLSVSDPTYAELA